MYDVQCNIYIMVYLYKYWITLSIAFQKVYLFLSHNVCTFLETKILYIVFNAEYAGYLFFFHGIVNCCFFVKKIMVLIQVAFSKSPSIILSEDRL